MSRMCRVGIGLAVLVSITPVSKYTNSSATEQVSDLQC
jgi:hypothetical protein